MNCQRNIVEYWARWLAGPITMRTQFPSTLLGKLHSDNYGRFAMRSSDALMNTVQTASLIWKNGQI